MILVARSIGTAGPPGRVLVEGGPPRDLFDGEASVAISAPGQGLAEAAAATVLGLSRRLYGAVLRAWMAEEGVEADLLAVAADCAARGEVALADYARPSLSRLAASVRRVSKEIHLLEGFARFSPLSNGRYVARLEPVHNVLPALAPFFLGRFGDTPFALVDLGRAYALGSAPMPTAREGAEEGGRVAPAATTGANEEDREAGRVNGGAAAWIEASMGDALAALEPDLDDAEALALWRSYFRVVENRSRHNPALQRRLMPARYWRQLTELGGQ
jgi:probable DNA metabolism protein